MERVVQQMETKGKQIHVIRDHMKKLKEKKKIAKRKEKNEITVGGSQEVEVVTTIRTKGNKSPEVKTNPKLDMLKKVQKLQSTLRKDDLNWE